MTSLAPAAEKAFNASEAICSLIIALGSRLKIPKTFVGIATFSNRKLRNSLEKE